MAIARYQTVCRSRRTVPCTSRMPRVDSIAMMPHASRAAKTSKSEIGQGPARISATSAAANAITGMPTTYTRSGVFRLHTCQLRTLEAVRRSHVDRGLRRLASVISNPPTRL